MPPKKKDTKGTKKIQPNTQIESAAGESKIKNADLLKSYGRTGTYLVNGIITEEYNKDLIGFKGTVAYDKMRKSDAQVAASLAVCELPIKGANWFVDPAEDETGVVTELDHEIAEFVSDNLFNRMTTTWNNFLGEALKCLQYGHAPFEKVFASDGEKVWLHKMGYRKPITIKQWADNNGNPGIVQTLPEAVKDPSSPNFGNQEVFIPASKLVIFINAQEGENYEGVSVLRPTYKHWYFKDKLYKFDAVRHERQSVGIPVIYVPTGTSDADKKEALDLVQNIRASEQSGVVVPGSKEDGWLFEFADLKAGDNTNLFESIKHHNREITKSTLSQFIELGSTESGSRSLGDSQTNFFFQACESYIQNICDTMNRFCIPELVDLNYDVERYPKLKAKKLNQGDIQTFSEALSKMVTNGVITIDEDLEQFVRDYLDIPKRVEGSEGRETPDDKKKETPKKTDVDKNIDSPEDKKKKKKEASDDAKKDGEFEDDLMGLFYDSDYMQNSALFNNRVILDLQNQVASKQDGYDLKKKLKFNSFEKEAFRPLTFAERKVNLTGLKRSMKTFEDSLLEEFDEISKKQKQDLLKQVKKAVDGNDIKALGAIKLKYSGDLSAALTNVQKEMFEIGKKGAALEMSVTVPATSKEVRGAMRIQTDAVIDSVSNSIENEAKTAATTVINQKGGSITSATSAEVVAAVSVGIDKKIQQARATLTSLGVTGAVNLGRTSIFERYPEKIYAMQYSAILDENTTRTCQSLDGRVVLPGSKEFYIYSPPRHFNCRSIWVEILQDEIFKPKITGIPSSIPAAKTLSTAKDLNAPVLLKGAPAIKIIQKEIKERQTKLQQLKTSGKYPNRQKQHETKIKELEKAIDGKFCESLKEYFSLEHINFD